MTKEDIIKEYISFVKKNERYPTLVDLKSEDITRDMMRHHYGTLEKLKKAAQDSGKIKGSILDVSFIDSHQIKKTIKHLNKFKRFVVTTAVSNAKVNKKFYHAIKTYCKKEDAALIVLPSTNKGSGDKWTIAPDLAEEHIVFYDLRLNENLSILGVASNAKTADPMSGLPRLSRSNGSIICASPKQSLKYVPTGINKLPHALMSTGAITDPEYSHEAVMQSKQNYLADNDHILGAIVVELDKSNKFHFRQIQADEDGGFADLGYYYDSKGKKKYSPVAMMLADWHTWETDPTVACVTAELSKQLNIPEWLVQDVFSGLSVNPHEMEKHILLSKRAEKGELSLSDETKQVAIDLNWMSTKTDKVTVIESNHHDFILRYLDSGQYVNHPYNQRAALQMALDMLDDKNPLEEQCKRFGLSDKVVFLKRDESYKIADIECGQHGDRGQNGARASLKGLEESYGKIVVGHTHTAGIKGQAWQVGTSTHMQLTYNQGASSWTNTHCLIYENGNRQLINIIEGQYSNRKT